MYTHIIYIFIFIYTHYLHIYIYVSIYIHIHLHIYSICMYTYTDIWCNIHIYIYTCPQQISIFNMTKACTSHTWSQVAPSRKPPGSWFGNLRWRRPGPLGIPGDGFYLGVALVNQGFMNPEHYQLSQVLAWELLEVMESDDVASAVGPVSYVN